MKSVNIGVLKNELSKYLKMARAGETIVVMDRNEPVAEIVPIPPAKLDPYEQMAKEGLIRPPLRKVKELRISGTGKKIDWLEDFLREREDRF
ncbi:MAG: type II toxin-antitoxin system prevent-host-death family antitoxin [Deltaproteobacteria bacterium]|nr:type II toxin-antitoxin system prevent-host-death family antitoxin [Deltaproteobacteria bacterium]